MNIVRLTSLSQHFIATKVDSLMFQLERGLKPQKPMLTRTVRVAQIVKKTVVFMAIVSASQK